MLFDTVATPLDQPLLRPLHPQRRREASLTWRGACARCETMSRLCNEKIVSEVQQVICFAFHDSRLLLETCRGAKELRKIVTLFYLD